MSRFTPLLAPPAGAGGDAYWFVFRGGEILVRRGSGRIGVPCCSEPRAVGIDMARTLYLGMLDQQHCYACEAGSNAPPPAGMEFLPLRALVLEGDETLTDVAGRAMQIKEWDRTHRYCGSCGTATVEARDERARQCPACKMLFYPRLAPVVMVLVSRGRELLLTRKPGYAAGRYTVVAGFVEPGETVEHAAAREVREEVGVEIAGLRYFGSQPWPFPHALVLAFHAEYAGGTMRADPSELEEARWFRVDALPELPEGVHISRRLIDAKIAALAG